MPYVVIDSFKHGLDGRRLSLTSTPGTLEVAENVHINEGGEVQKRKAFVIDQVKFPANTFGLQPTDSGLETYGSDVTPSGLPTGIIYVQLQHPTVVDGGVYNVTYHAMTGVTMTDNYNGKAFVVASFSDGRSFLYYDGTLVDQSRWGIVMEGLENLHNLGLSLVSNIGKVSGWAGVANISPLLVPTDGSDLIYSPSGISYDPTIEYTSAAGILASYEAGTDGAGTSLARAYTVFTISGSISAGATITITAPTTPTSGDSVTLGTVAYQGGDTLTTFTARLVATINGNLNYGYAAESSVGVIAIIAPAAWQGFLGNGVVITATYAVCTVAATGTLALIYSATVVPTLAVGVINNPAPTNVTVLTTSIVVCTPKGGTGPFTFLWTLVSGDSISITDSKVGATYFYAALAVNETRQAKFKCTVTDTGAANLTTDSPPVTVRLYHGP